MLPLSIKLKTINLLQHHIEYLVDNDPAKFESYTDGTDWEDCTTYDDIGKTSVTVIENYVYDEFILTTISTLTQMFSTIIFMEYFIRKEKEISIQDLTYNPLDKDI